jgi:hypothetical protein
VNWTATQIHQVRLGAAMEYGHAIPAPPARPMNRETFRADPGKAASAALPLDHVAASQRCERSSNKRSKSRRFRVPALANSILGLIVLALLFVFLYGPDKLVETVSPGYMCNQSAPEAIKVVRREAERLLSFGDFYATRAINSNVPAALLLSIFKMDTATNRKVGRVTYCTGILTIGSSPEFEAAAEQAIIDYAKKEAKDAARYKFLAEPTLAAFRKTRGQLPRQTLRVQYSAQILDNGNWAIQDVSVNPLSTR